MNPVEHFVLPGITWATCQRILREIGERHYRMAYLNGELEFMTVELGHSSCSRWIGNLIFFTALELNMPLCSGGSTTLMSASRKVGIEPDECFWIKHEKRMRRKKNWRAAVDPPPDLVVEIDITASSLDRLEIYAALNVPEVWRFDEETLKVLVLGPSGKYKKRAKSMAFPSLPVDGIARFVKKLGSADEVSLLQEFTDWLRSKVVAKKAGGERKNGRQ